MLSTSVAQQSFERKDQQRLGYRIVVTTTSEDCISALQSPISSRSLRQHPRQSLAGQSPRGHNEPMLRKQPAAWLGRCSRLRIYVKLYNIILYHIILFYFIIYYIEWARFAHESLLKGTGMSARILKPRFFVSHELVQLAKDTIRVFLGNGSHKHVQTCIAGI